MSLKIQPDDPPTLTQAEEEEMSTALIAKLLAQDAMNAGGNDYYAEYGNESQYHTYSNDYDYDYGEESDDYAPKRHGKQKKIKSKKKEPQQRGRKRKSASIDFDISSSKTTSGNPSSGLDKIEKKVATEPTVKIKKVKKPLPAGFNTGTYTDHEEVLFLEGLDLHGRNWNDLAKHMGTRDPHSIRSHAQKHFIKLYRDNLPLPDKVKESGEGFTLSGKPLDPDSASAKPYLNRTSISNKTPNVPVADVTCPSKTQAASKDKLDPVGQPDAFKSNGSCEGLGNMEQTTEELNIGRLTLMPADQDHQLHYVSTDNQATPPPTPTDKSSGIQAMTITTHEGNGCTNHAASKLRHPGNGQNSSGSSTIVKRQPFIGNPGSDTPGAQPFELTLHSNALLMMDLHAHLMTIGIFGYLAGEWNAKTKCIHVKEAYPCASLTTDHDVTMDPASALETRHTIEEKGMSVVGWYHSHPACPCDPSLMDIGIQHKYQTQSRLSLINTQEDSNTQSGNMDDATTDHCRTTSNGMEPFVGAIIGPYEQPVSTVNWFHVEKDGITPKQLICNVQQDTQLSPQEEMRLLQLPAQYKSFREKMDLGEPWQSHGTKLDKLMTSLATRMPGVQNKQQDDGTMDSFLEKIRDTLMCW